MFGTSRRMSSVTRDPFKLRMQRSSRFFKRLLSDNSRSSGIRASDNRAHTKSIYNCQLVSLFRLMAEVDLMNCCDTHWYSRKVHSYDGYVSIDDGLLGIKKLLRYCEKRKSYRMCTGMQTYRDFANFLLLLEHVVHGGEEFLSFNMAR
jgi:hypothetical protein